MKIKSRNKNEISRTKIFFTWLKESTVESSCSLVDICVQLREYERREHETNNKRKELMQKRNHLKICRAAREPKKKIKEKRKEKQIV